MTISHVTAGQRVLEFAAEGRLIQGSWHKEQEGRHLACLLGSMGNGVKIDSASACPATVMPKWMAHLLVRLFDGQAAPVAVAWAQRLANQMVDERWSRLPWETIPVDWLIGTITDALEAARKVAGKKAYWVKVEDANRQVCAALRGNGDLKEARAAALSASSAAYAAADADAYAAYAAYAAAYAAADAAADVVYAAYAAYAAAYAAYAADAADAAAAYAADAADAAAAYAADAARQSAYTKQATRLCDLIDAEYAAMVNA